MRIILTTAAALLIAAALPAQDNTSGRKASDIGSFLVDSLDSGREEILEQLANLPNIEVGKGVTFRPKNDSYEMTIRFRMQNMAGLSFNRDFRLMETEAQVKRLRLRFDGYIFSPKFLYSIQLGFSGYDAKQTPNGNVNIIRDAIVYYKPNSSWNLGFGQTKLKTNRARINSSSALQFVDRSIVNSEFGGDRDFGFFGEYHYGNRENFALAALASVTLGEGRNWRTSDNGGFAYTGRLELFPFGKFESKGEYIEGDTNYEEKVKIMLAGAYSFNDNALLDQSFKGDLLPDGRTADIGAYYADFILKYRGFALNADYMGRHTYGASEGIFTGCGVNAQASYLFDSKWEIAVRNSIILPDSVTRPQAGYSSWNQSTIGITRYIIGHSLKVQFDASYNHMADAVSDAYSRWGFRFQIELGL